MLRKFEGLYQEIDAYFYQNLVQLNGGEFSTWVQDNKRRGTRYGKMSKAFVQLKRDSVKPSSKRSSASYDDNRNPPSTSSHQRLPTDPKTDHQDDVLGTRNEGSDNRTSCFDIFMNPLNIKSPSETTLVVKYLFDFGNVVHPHKATRRRYATHRLASGLLNRSNNQTSTTL